MSILLIKIKFYNEMGYVINFIIIEICKIKFIFEIDKLLK